MESIFETLISILKTSGPLIVVTAIIVGGLSAFYLQVQERQRKISEKKLEMMVELMLERWFDRLRMTTDNSAREHPNSIKKFTNSDRTEVENSYFRQQYELEKKILRLTHEIEKLNKKLN